VWHPESAAPITTFQLKSLGDENEGTSHNFSKKDGASAVQAQ
jgi:hypothetical protein